MKSNMPPAAFYRTVFFRAAFSREPARRLALLCLAALLAASPAVARGRPGSGVYFAPDAITAQIRYLASDELKGRGSGEPGNEKAAQFVAAEFARCGLKPLGAAQQRDPKATMNDRGYFQPFLFVAGRAVGKGNRLAFQSREIAPPFRVYRIGQEFEPSGVSGAGAAQGEVVFVGYGIQAPKEQHDDYEGVDVKGKIVLLLAGSPKDDPHSPLAEYADIRRKAGAARDQGATAVLVVLPRDSHPSSAPTAGLADVSDAGLPVLRVRYAVAETWLKSRGLATLIADADAGKKVSFACGQARLAADVKKVQKVTANVVGFLEGSDPVLKNEVVIIGAHLDHLGMGGPGSGSLKPDLHAIHHGADDNASGTAGVMQLARYFAGSNSASPAAADRKSGLLKRSIVFLCFSGEELGLLGSDYYVKHPLVPLEKTVAMINMDMIGRLRDNKLIISGSGTAKEWNSLLDDLNKTAGFTLARSDSGFGASDQQSFYLKSIPVLFFFTGNHPQYHTPADTIDLINASGEAKVLQMVAECAERIADNPDRPTFQRITTPDQNAPSRGFRVYFGSVPDYAAMVEGVQLNGVREGSPAEKSGLKQGDIIVKFGDRTIKNIYDYTYALQDHKPGDLVTILARRGDKTLTFTVTLVARPE